MLRRSFMIAILAFTALSIPAFAHGDRGKDGKGWDTKAYVEKLTKDLNLTPEQATQIQTIMDAKHEKMKAQHDETKSQIDAVLTPEQRTKYDAMKEDWKKNKKEKGWKGHKHVQE